MINTKRMLLAFVAAYVVSYLYEFVVFGMLLQSFHAQFPTWLKPQDQLPLLRMALTLALNIALVTVFYCLFARNRASNVVTGLVFGFFLGMIAGWVPQAFNKLLLNNYPFYTVWAPAIFFEVLLVGATLGLVYRE